MTALLSLSLLLFGQASETNREMELSFNIGLQFGLTDATSDTALKFQGSLSF